MWEKMETRRRRDRVPKVAFRMGQNVPISKEKMRFAKAAEENFITEIFRVAKVIEMRPRGPYEIEDLNRTPRDD